ncbi:MAG: copper chaperone PCu(A)C [Salinarimonadaceae bacterium]|nr:MAG: copper chaperone PCu(A)C [Salinarimonadaceae bacterium]
MPSISTFLRGALAAAALVLTPNAASAETFAAGDIVVEAPWTRATPGGARVAGGYMRISNNGAEPDRLLGGTTTVAPRFEVHSMEMVDGVARMAEVAGGLVIPPGETVELAPGGYHIMMMGLTAPVTEASEVAGTLVFERAGEIAVTYAVAPIGSREAPGGGHDHHHGHGQGHGHGHNH